MLGNNLKKNRATTNANDLFTRHIVSQKDETMNFLPELWNYIKQMLLAVIFISVIGAGAWVAYVYDISKKPQNAAKQLIVEGDNALNIGRYQDAERIFEAELNINPQNQQAAWGLKIAQIGQILFQPEFKEAIDTLYQQDPNDAHVNLFLGEFYAINDQSAMAVKHFEAAIEQNPKLAEAHNDLAMLYEQQGDFEQAKVESLKAIDIATIAKYRNNLGTIYFKQQHFEEAIKEYGKNKEYPLSALESAEIYWRLEFLSQASNYQKQAIEWLEDKTIMSKPENQEAWFFEIPPGKEIVLPTLEDKKSYAYFCLSASLYLQGDREGAENRVQKLRDLKAARQADINTLITTKLDELVQANSHFAAQVDAYKKLYLEEKTPTKTPMPYSESEFQE